MAITATTTPTGAKLAGGGPGVGGGSDGWRDGGGGRGFGGPQVLPTHQLGMWLALASISMLFIGLTSAYVVRQGLDPGWQSVRMPTLLLVNTAVLLASSVTMELARRRSKLRSTPGALQPEAGWLAATLVLGLVFLAGQLAAWRSLSHKGIFLSTNAHGSFVYLLTGLHGLHLLGGIVFLSYLVIRAWQDHDLAEYGGQTGGQAGAARRARRVEAAAIYWHFMGGLWIYLLLLLFVWT
jgi:cytochrome c oxidase subunit 3